MVRAFRTDSAREWLVKDLEKYSHAKEIDAQKSPPHEQWANGVAERTIGLIKELARCMIIDAGAPHQR